MKDPRLKNLARVLTQYSLKLKPGDILAINGEAVAAPLIRECYRAALRCGAFVICDVALDGLPEIFYAEANDKQLKWLSPFARYKVRRIDASLGIWADENTRSLTSVDPKRLATAAAARKPLHKLFMDRAAQGDLRWVGTQWPCNANAQDAEMSLEEYEEFVFGAGHLDDRLLPALKPVQIAADLPVADGLTDAPRLAASDCPACRAGGARGSWRPSCARPRRWRPRTGPGRRP